MCVHLIPLPCRVFLKLYIRNEDNIDRLQLYNMNFRSAYYASPSPYISTFLGRRALNILSREPSDGRPVLSGRTVNDSVHPGCDSVMCPEGDPTVLAIVLGTYYGENYIHCMYMYVYHSGLILGKKGHIPLPIKNWLVPPYNNTWVSLLTQLMKLYIL